MDRMDARVILNALIFCNFIGYLEQTVSIIGIDYQQVLNKLIHEKNVGISEYDVAISYLDKFILFRYVIDNYYELDGYVRNLFGSFVSNESLDKALSDIAKYLSTPRNIKKWIHFLSTYELVVSNELNANYKIPILQILAVFSKHPTIWDNLVKSKKISGIMDYLISAGISSIKENEREKDSVDELNERIKIIRTYGLTHVKNPEAFEINSIDSFKNIGSFEKDYILSRNYDEYRFYLDRLLVKVLESDRYVESGEINQLLEMIQDDFEKSIPAINEKLGDIKIRGVIEDIQIDENFISLPPLLDNLDKIWGQHISNNKYNLYGSSIEYLLKSLLGSLVSMMGDDYTLLKAGLDNYTLSFGELCTIVFLDKLNVKNEKGRYDFSKIKNHDDKGKAIIRCEAWIQLVKDRLGSDDPSSSYQEPGIVSVFYRFIQFSSAIYDNNPKKMVEHKELLGEYVLKFLNNDSISSEKKHGLISKFSHKDILGGHPIFSLFNKEGSNNQSEIINALKRENKKLESPELNYLSYMDVNDQTFSS